MFQNFIKTTGVILITTLVFLFWCVDVGAADGKGDHCSDHAVGKFSFSVSNPIGITMPVEIVEVGEICPGCSLDWGYNRQGIPQGPFMQFDVTGNMACYFDMSSDDDNLVSEDGHVTCRVWWGKLTVLGTELWQGLESGYHVRKFMSPAGDDEGIGMACFRCYLTFVGADCLAKAKDYKWKTTVTVNYVCSFDQSITGGGGNGHHF